MEIYGALRDHAETGTEGTWWSIQRAIPGFANLDALLD